MAASVLDRYLDRDGRLKVFPAKISRQRLALVFLAARFEPGREYSEAEVNTLLRRHHTFDDPAFLRRALFDWGFLDRTLDGARYWLVASNAE